MKHIVFILLLFLVNPVFIFSQTTIKNAVDNFAKTDIFTNASIGVCVMDVNSGEIVASYNSNKSLIPASSLKVLTTSTALDLLGADYTFKTELHYDGQIDADGTLQGNIIIKGFGDPVLGSPNFVGTDDMETILNKWTAAIKAAGIKKVNGVIIGDDSYFDFPINGRTWLWEDMGNYYGAGARGLNFHENLYYLNFNGGSQIGTTPSIKNIDPHVPNLMHVNEVTFDAKGTGDNAYIFGTPYSYTCFIRGTIPVGTKTFTIKGAIPDPPFFAAHALLTTLEANGIATQKKATSIFEFKRTGKVLGAPKLLATHQSPTLLEIIKIANLKSVNLYCETLLKTLGKVKKGKGSFDAGIEVIYEYLKNKGLDTKGLFLEDGSGLSPRNGITAFQLANILKLVATNPSLFEQFYQTLPAAGQTGTIKYMFKGTIAVGKLKAKSGGLTRVRSYTGYAKNKSGKRLAFSIIANNFEGKSSEARKAMEKLMIEFCK